MRSPIAQAERAGCSGLRPSPNHHLAAPCALVRLPSDLAARNRPPPRPMKTASLSGLAASLTLPGGQHQAQPRALPLVNLLPRPKGPGAPRVSQGHSTAARRAESHFLRPALQARRTGGFVCANRPWTGVACGSGFAVALWLEILKSFGPKVLRSSRSEAPGRCDRPKRMSGAAPRHSPSPACGCPVPACARILAWEGRPGPVAMSAHVRRKRWPCTCGAVAAGNQPVWQCVATRQSRALRDSPDRAGRTAGGLFGGRRGGRASATGGCVEMMRWPGGEQPRVCAQLRNFRRRSQSRLQG